MTEPTAPDGPDAATEAAWAPYLDAGERLLWTGEPAGGIRFRRSDWVMIPAAAVWCLFVSIGQARAIASGETSLSLFGGVFMLLGLYLLIGRFFVDAHERRHTRYALTDRRAIVAKSAWGRQLMSFPIDPTEEIELREGPPDTVVFARESPRVSRSRPLHFRRGPRRYRDIEYAFEFIPDGKSVYRLIRAVQAGAET
ncbi:MAG: hypothetical protein ACFBSD_16130 [Paracoccaceae bacterium]